MIPLIVGVAGMVISFIIFAYAIRQERGFLVVFSTTMVVTFFWVAFVAMHRLAIENLS